MASTGRPRVLVQIVQLSRVRLGGRYILVVLEPRFRRFWKKALNDFENGI